jgi:hypothetical protein
LAKQGERYFVYAAEVILVADGEHCEVRDFRLPPPLKKRTVSGVALMPDGSPAAGATVTLEFTEREWIEIESVDAQGKRDTKK